MKPDVFVQIANRWDQIIAGGLTQTVSNAVIANATLLTSMLTLYVIISGVLTMFGRMSMAEWVFGATRAAIIAMLLTAAGFNQFIQQPLMTDIPNWIAQSVNGDMGAQTAPQQFDVLRNAVIEMKAHILQQASGLIYIGQRIECGFVTLLILGTLLVSFFMWEFARGMMGFLVAVAPFVIGLYLFRATRHIPLNLLGTAVSLLALMVMLSTMVRLALAADMAFLKTIEMGASADQMIDAETNVLLFFLFSCALIVASPYIAMRIGGGFVPTLGAMVAPLTTMARTAMRAGRP